nr:Metridin ShK toxin domain containing protein [Haemonchus contortus]
MEPSITTSAKLNMFFYIVCALFLINAFTSEAETTTKFPCYDAGGEQFCLGPKHAGMCNKPDFYNIAETYCSKTCGICTQW